MAESKRRKVKALEREIKICRSWRGFCGILGMLAVALVPLSVLFGNKTLTLCAISWIAGSFFAFLSSAAELRNKEIENEICDIKLSDQLSANSRNSAPESAETYLGFIGMN